MKPRARKRLAWTALALSLAALLVLAWTQGSRFTPVTVGSRAPRYEAKTLDGRTVSLQSLRGKVVVLNVWATWCRPCRAEMPALERLHQQFIGRGLEIVAVSVDTPLGTFGPSGNVGGDVGAYTREMGLTFTILHDPARTIEDVFPIQGLPTTFIIDKDGRIDQKVVGARAWDEANYVKYFNNLLQS
jgi:cytochrome c biogenesis protein CcmG, thiol:disulfide interchange protein DsbE